MTQDTISITILIIVIIVAIFSVILLIYYSSYVDYGEDDYTDESNSSIDKKTTIRDIFITKSIEQKNSKKYLVKISKNQKLDNNIQNNTLLTFEGNNHLEIILPDNNPGLCLNFWNGSRKCHTIISDKPILCKNDVSLNKNLPVSTFISLICTESSWLLINKIGDDIKTTLDETSGITRQEIDNNKEKLTQVQKTSILSGNEITDRVTSIEDDLKKLFNSF